MTKQNIEVAAKQLFARVGYEGFSIRTLAETSNISISSIYHFFSDKDTLLKHIFDTTNTALGVRRSQLPDPANTSEMLRSRIEFQFDNIEDIVFVLKYYIHFRETFRKRPDGYLPPKSALHIEEVIEAGNRENVFTIPAEEIGPEAKMAAHMINGFLLEYYPAPVNRAEKQNLTNSIHDFIFRALKAKEGE